MYCSADIDVIDSGGPESRRARAWSGRGEDIQCSAAPKWPQSQFPVSGEQTSGALPSRCALCYLKTLVSAWCVLCTKYAVNFFICHTNTAVLKDTPIPQRLEMPSFMPPKHLDLTIYPTEVGVSSVSGREGEVQMLSTAIKITLDPQRNVKACPHIPDSDDDDCYCCCFGFLFLVLFTGVPRCLSPSRCHHATLHDAD